MMPSSKGQSWLALSSLLIITSGLCPAPTSGFHARTIATPRGSSSTELHVLANDFKEMLYRDKALDVWEQLVAEPIRRRVQYSTPTISLGPATATSSRVSDFSDIIEPLMDSFEETLRSFREHLVTPEDTAGLAPLAYQREWAAFVDNEGTGLVYYFNCETGESQWDPPTHDFPVVETQPKALVVEGVWEAHLDKQTQSIYYFNRNTGESQWTRPYATFPPIPTAQYTTSRATPEPLATHGEWHAYLDEVTSQVYYFNTMNGKRTWDAPKGFPGLPIRKGETFLETLLETGQSHSKQLLHDIQRSMLSFVSSEPTGPDRDWIAYLFDKLEEERNKASNPFGFSLFPLHWFGRPRTHSAHNIPVSIVWEKLVALWTPEPSGSDVTAAEYEQQIVEPTVHKNLAHLTRWKRNKDRSLTGVIRHSSNQPLGTKITTTPVIDGSRIAKRNVVRTLSGNEYYLL